MLDAILSSLDEATARGLKRLAWRQGLTLSDFVRQVLEDHVNGRGMRTMPDYTAGSLAGLIETLKVKEEREQ